MGERYTAKASQVIGQLRVARPMKMPEVGEEYKLNGKTYVVVGRHLDEVRLMEKSDDTD